jgi:hypothetical protein
MDTMFYTDGIIPYERALRRMLNCLLAAAVCTVVLCTAMFAYGLFAPGGDEQLTDIYDTSLLPYVVNRTTLQSNDVRPGHLFSSNIAHVFKKTALAVFLITRLSLIIIIIIMGLRSVSASKDVIGDPISYAIPIQF